MQQLPPPRLTERELGGLPVLTDDALFRDAGVRIAFTGRAGGTSCGPFASLNTGGHVGDDAHAVERNRGIVASALGAAGAPLVVPAQVHGTHVTVVRDAEDAPRAVAEAQAGTDAVAVACRGVAALLNFADCLPLVLVAPGGAFTVVHAGWRGAVEGIASRAAGQLACVAGADPASFNAYAGPHIRWECFEVGPDVAGRFAERYGLAAVPDPRHVSLVAAVFADLAAAGLRPERMADAGICTACNPGSYFSYRASGGECGRHAAAAFRP